APAPGRRGCNRWKSPSEAPLLKCRMQNAECRIRSGAILHSAFCILHFDDHFHLVKMPLDMYRSAPSGMIVMTLFPGPRRFATWSAPTTFAPDDDPPRIPSSAAMRAHIA